MTVWSLVPKTRKGSRCTTVSLQKHERFHNFKLWPVDYKQWVWACSGARPSGNHGTSLTFLKHLQSTSRQVISSVSQRFSGVFFWRGGGNISYISFPLTLFFSSCKLQKEDQYYSILEHIDSKGVRLRNTGWKPPPKDSSIHLFI